MRLGIRGLWRLAVLTLVFCALSAAVGAQEVLRLRVATAVSGSGIMDVLKPAFAKDTGIILQTSVAGSGRSLREGMVGVVDVLFLNAAEAEQAFMTSGDGVIRKPVMRGHYLLVGPPGDPADVGHAVDAVDAFKRISASRSMLVSRADDSGGHQREMSIWREAGIQPYGEWYYEVGLGVRRTLAVAEEQRAYMLLDEATWLRFGDQTVLKVLYREDPAFDDLYSVIAVNPALNDTVNLSHSRTFIDWITSPPVQEMIGAYEINGVRPFQPAINEDEPVKDEGR